MTTNKVTIEDVKANMKDVLTRTVYEFGKPCTYVTVRMRNGFTLRESTTCVDPANYDEEIGKQICLEKIEDKIWMLLGYELQSKFNEQEKSSYCRVSKGDNIGFVYGGKVYMVDDKGNISTTKMDTINYISSFSMAEPEPILKKEQLEFGKTYCMFREITGSYDGIFKVVDSPTFGKELMVNDSERGVYTLPISTSDEFEEYQIYHIVERN